MLADVTEIALVAADWRTRALLRAQLIEEGFAVKAFESIHDAAEAFAGAAEPGLLLVELSGGESSAELEQLSAWAARVPVWVIASRSLGGAAGLGERGFERILFRPIDVGELVEQIKRRTGP